RSSAIAPATASTDALSLHDALPIWSDTRGIIRRARPPDPVADRVADDGGRQREEERVVLPERERPAADIDGPDPGSPLRVVGAERRDERVVRDRDAEPREA